MPNPYLPPNANHSSECDPNCTYPTVATTSTQMPVLKSAAAFILVMVYNLATGKFAEVPYPTGRSQNEGNPSIHSSSPPPFEDIPNAPVRQDTPWPSTGSASENLFKTRKDWPIPPTPAPTVKTEGPPQTGAIPHAMVMPKQVIEKCLWGHHCHICIKEEEDGLEDWNGDRQIDQSKVHHPQNTQHPQSFDVPDRYSEQMRLRKEWDEKKECLNEKYGLDCFFSSESDSDLEPEYKYETLI